VNVQEFFTAVRKQTAGLLGFTDLDALTATQTLKLDVATSLRLEIDRLQSQQLRGEAADLRVLIAAAEMLERLLKPVEVAAEAADQHCDAREKLAALIDGLSAAAEHEWAEACSRESEAAATSPPAPARIGPPPRQAHVEYIDGACLDARDEPSTSAHVPPAVGVAATPSKRTSEPARAPGAASDAEWLSWYRSGGDTGRGIHSIPKDF
jgi:hypothetical protein